MGSVKKILEQLRREPTNVRFADLRKVCEAFFGEPRQNGTSHLIFKMPWQGDPRVNIQDAGGKAKHLSSAAGAASNRQTGGQTMSLDHYTYRVTWSPEDGEHVGLCIEFPSLSWLAQTPEEALAGVRKVVAEVVADLEANGELVPQPLSEKHYSGEFRVRIPPELHRQLALMAAEQGVSLNRLASAKLAAQVLLVRT